jgi:NAD(P)-dependent dehydrogenase (short-subunit alcohol dehydrogenase family)
VSEPKPLTTDGRTNQLQGRTVVVFGASGQVGFGVAAAMLRAGARVLLPTRSVTTLAATRDALPPGEAVLVEGDVSDPSGADELRKAIVAAGRPDHVVASIGSWWMGGRFVEQPAAEFERVRRMLFDAQIHAARTLLPLLSGSAASHTIITGEGAHMVRTGLSLLTIATAGTIALSKVLRTEHAEGPRVNELIIRTRVERTRSPGVVLSEEVGAALVQIATSAVRSAILPFETLAAFSVDKRLGDR